MTAPLGDTTWLCYKGGPDDVGSIDPALTSTLFWSASAMSPIKQNPPAWQSAIDRFADTRLLDAGDIFIEGCDAGEMCWSDVRGLPIGRFGHATGFVYFATVGMELPTHVKVGFTSGNPWKRVASLQTGCPFSLALVQVIPGNPGLEAAIHHSLRADRVSGEWFDLSAQVRDIIRSYWDERL